MRPGAWRGLASFKTDRAANSRAFSAGIATMDRTYVNAVNIIENRRRLARPCATDNQNNPPPPPDTKPVPTAHTKSSAPRGTPSLLGMSEWLQLLGYSAKDINALNVVHIAGTKGKGSTCAFTEAFLRVHGERTGFPAKTGLYTSPHLMRPEERIRINFQPLSQDLFARYFFEVYDRLPQLRTDYDSTKDVVDRGPRYLQLFALFAFHVFAREKVDVTILETHNGGEYDATNVVQKPLVTAVTALGMDHIEMLGPTLENISWHKGGIYKPGATALSAIQVLSAAEVLKSRAADQGQDVRFVDVDSRLPQDSIKLKPAVQRMNSSLAIAAAESFLRVKTGKESEGFSLSQTDIARGVEQFAWPGRFQPVPDGKHTWFLDAAHNEMSVPIAAQWFAETSKLLQQDALRILIFSHINELRDTAGLLESLATALRESHAGVSHVIFSTYDESAERKSRDVAKDTELFHTTWQKILPDTQRWDEPTIQGAMERARKIGEGHPAVHTLITGSQHLVGPALRVLEERKTTA